MFLRRFDLAPRATFCFALITLLAVLIGLFSLSKLSNLYHAEQDIETNWMASIQAAERMQKDALRMRLETWRGLILSDGGAAARIDSGLVQGYRQDFQQTAERYQRELVSGAREQELLQRVRAVFDTYSAAQQQVMDLQAQQQAAAASTQANGPARSAGKELEKVLDELSTYNTDGARQAGTAAGDTYAASRLSIIVTLVVAVSLTALLALLLTRSIVRPVGEALESAESIAKGDLTRAVSVSGNDELSRLLAAQSSMQRSLNAAIRQIADSSTQLASAAEEMATVTEQGTRGLESQNAEIEQAATAVNEMSAAVEEVSRNANAASEAARSSDRFAQTGNQQVTRTVDAIRRLAARVNDAAGEIQGLAEQARGISKVLDVIRSIAEQTNLLALNAAIEAARAGEQGRGFAVVADEVRALAHRTSSSTQEIEQMIGAIQNGTEHAVQAMRSSSDEAAATLSLADEAGRSLEDVVRAISEINERNLQIATASEEQAHVARDVDRNLVSIRDLSLQTASGANQSASACGELARLAQGLNGLVARFRV
ncbi:methyl-accepting chemotaxis protein [Pseudomonas mangiferae]|uniref:Methyl-accepting chemotaxis protein n=2 Tax=Pseudomonas mangiferae TaxID=2593654 RepID=A0A553GVA9_9PSED|nr:methyl-accepting chemotaxis protein [Pseudomonas mangiferae]TRX73395.1 methyl-accepting chemotaxis protein [Pseudomonas mangiferae]